MFMVERTWRKSKSADYKGIEVFSTSGNDLYNLRELDIKKEYLLNVVLPFAHELNSNEPYYPDYSNYSKESNPVKSEPVDVLVKDRANYWYIRRLVAEVLPSGTIGLYEALPKRKVPVSEYSISFNGKGMVFEATEDRNIYGKHVSVVYKVDEKEEGNKASFEAHPYSVTVSFKQGDKEIKKLYVASELTGEDILEEIKFPDNFAQVITLRSDE